uniref:Polymerase delta-interacting protein 3-like n=1 Tax=Sinocyclocheilus grahami TaxID=75366 RepID=A0A672K866_SINGR
MADLSLDEVIRRRSFNARGVSKRPIYGRGAGPVGGAFDARQMIGSGDVRQRLGVKDAREKLGQKDARFRIRGRGGGAGAGAGAVQDARQLLNSRKQQQAPPPMDARDRLSLKRSVPTTSNQSAAFLKITKTIQVTN